MPAYMANRQPSYERTPRTLSPRRQPALQDLLDVPARTKGPAALRRREQQGVDAVVLRGALHVGRQLVQHLDGWSVGLDSEGTTE